ncbi:MAG: transposase, partial [Rikenellaceae bacterium]
MGVKHYDKQFKERAVKLSYQRSSISQAARELGVSDSQLSKWRKDYAEYGESSFPGRGVERLTDEQREIKRLQKELKDKELDLEILKNAI